MGMRRAFRALAGAAVAAAGAACSPLGPPIDAETSRNYYLSRTRGAVVYSAGGNWFKLGHTVLDADVSTFRPLGSAVAVDQTRVFYRAHAQPQIDRSTFDVQGLVMRDARHVYYPSGGQPRLSILEGADPRTFAYLLPETENPREWAKDAHRVYRNHTPVEGDPETFVFLNRAFVADATRLFSRRLPHRVIREINEPYEVLNDYHLRLGNEILSGGLWPVQVLSFEEIHEIREVSPLVLMINGRVYARGEPFPYADVDHGTFEGWPGNQTFARDANSVYFIFSRIERIEGADPDTFIPFENYGSYARDAHRIYYQQEVLDDADRATFEVVQEEGRWFARDRHGSFFMGRRER